MADNSAAQIHEAYDSLSSLVAEAQRVAELFDQIGHERPHILRMVLGSGSGNPAHSGVRNGAIGRSVDPKRPKEWRNGWIWIDEGDMYAQGVLLGVLRSSESPLHSKEVITQCLEIIPNVSSGSLFNAGARLERIGVINRGDDGWSLVKREVAPVHFEGKFWGPPDAFAKQELAAYRRGMIKHILSHSPDGLQQMQIVNALRSAGCKAPVAKELVKADLEAMRGSHEIRRVGNSKKWVPVENESR